MTRDRTTTHQDTGHNLNMPSNRCHYLRRRLRQQKPSQSLTQDKSRDAGARPLLVDSFIQPPGYLNDNADRAHRKINGMGRCIKVVPNWKRNRTDAHDELVQSLTCLVIHQAAYVPEATSTTAYRAMRQC